jgi:putative ABC transport system permease protein
VTGFGFGLGLRLLRSAHRSGELRVLLVSVALAVAAITAVGMFTDRIGRVLSSQGAELLGADRVVVGDNPPPAAWCAQARALGLQTTQTWSFVSMVQGPNGGQLASVKAVGAGYPLRGRLQVRAHRQQDGRPPAGEVWLEPRLLRWLGLEAETMGATALTLGDRQVRATGLVVREPDRAGDFFNIGARLMMRLEDVGSTGLVQDYSRVRYRLLIAGDEQALGDFKAWLAPRLRPGDAWQGVEDARPAVRTALERARVFLGLSAAVAVLLATVAVALASRRHAERHLDDSAVLRCLGASRRLIVRIVMAQLIALGLLASILGGLLGLAAQQALVLLFDRILMLPLPAPSPLPWLVGAGVGLASLAVFALPPLLRLRDTPPLRVLGRDFAPLPMRRWMTLLPALPLLAGLVVYQAGELRLGLYVLAGMAGVTALLGGTAWLLVALLGPVRRRAGVTWRFGLANLARRPAATVLQLVGFGVGAMALLLLTLVRSELFDAWRARLPAEAPNRFVIGISPDQVEPLGAALGKLLQDPDPAPPSFYPMIRGRLVEIAGRAIAPEDYPPGRARRLAAREFNLSYAERPPAHNRLVAGDWWGAPPRAPQFSVEQGIAATLGIRLGDRLTFLVAGTRVGGRVTNLRQVQWDSFKVNFFVVATPELLRNAPAGYITSFYLPRERDVLLDPVLREFPNLTMIDVGDIMDEIRAIMDRVSLALEVVFLFTLAAGLLVMAAAVQATRDERVRETALLRTLGATSRQLTVGLLAELGVLGLAAGLVGALGASLVGCLLATQVLDLPCAADPWVWLLGPLLTMSLVTLAGWLGLRRVRETPPAQVLSSA